MVQPEAKKRLVSGVRLTAAILAISTLNPVVNGLLTRLLRSYNEILSRQKNSINFVSMTLVVFSSLYYVYPSNLVRYLDTLLLTLMFSLTKVQLHQLLGVFKGLKGPRTATAAKHLLVSLMFVMKKNSLVKIVGAVRNFAGAQTVENIKILVIPVLGLLSKMDMTYFKTGLSLISSVSLIRLFSRNKFGETSQLCVGIISSIFFNPKALFPNPLVNYSFKTVTDSIFSKMVPSQIKQGKIDRYRKFQSLLIALVMVNLIKYVNSTNLYNADYESLPLSRFFCMGLQKIDKGVFEIPYLKNLLFRLRLSDFDSGDSDNKSALSSSSQQHNSATWKNRRPHHKIFMPKEPIKIYDNDYSLIVDPTL